MKNLEHKELYEMLIAKKHEDIISIDKTFEEIKEVEKSTNAEKELLYFSDSILIFKFVYRGEDELNDDGSVSIRGNEYSILQVYSRTGKNSSYHYCKEEKLLNSLLLNLINRGDAVGNKKGYL